MESFYFMYLFSSIGIIIKMLMYKLNFFWILILLMIFSWVSLYITLHNVSPVQSAELAFFLLYISFFLSVTFTVALLSSLLWKMFVPTKSSYVCLKNGIRFGMIVGVLFVMAVGFQQNALLGQNEIFTFILLGILIEIINILNNK